MSVTGIDMCAMPFVLTITALLPAASGRPPVQRAPLDEVHDCLQHEKDDHQHAGPGEYLGDREHLLRQYQPMPDPAYGTHQFRGDDDPHRQGKIDFPAGQDVGNDAGENDLGEELQAARPERMDHLPELERNGFHGVEAVDEKHRYADDAHHEEDP